MNPAPRLLLITDPEVAPNLIAAVAAAVRGGVQDVLLRAPGRTDQWLWETTLNLLAVMGRGRLLIHGRADIALAAGAAGVHLPERGPPVTMVRRLLGPDRLLGVSCHDLSCGLDALAAGADYITLSPLFPTPSHPGAAGMGLAAFGELCRRLPGPVLALGGITPDNARLALAAGAHGVALIRGILDRADPGQAAQQCQQAMGPGHAV